MRWYEVEDCTDLCGFASVRASSIHQVVTSKSRLSTPAYHHGPSMVVDKMAEDARRTYGKQRSLSVWQPVC
jgi:hypothetical protein